MLIRYLSVTGVLCLALITGLCVSYETVEPGTEAVGVRFGKVTGEVLGPGIHLVSPLLSWDHFLTLHNTSLFKEVVVPAADQQTATMDVSIQWRVLPGAAVKLRDSTGVWDRVFEVHFVPAVRGALRDAGRSTKRVEDFYSEDKIQLYRAAALARLTSGLGPMGIEVTDVIVRDVTLPPGITAAIANKKQREQEVEQQRAQLEKERLAAQQQVVVADANLAARQQDAKAQIVMADAKAYEIRKLQEQLAQSPNYVELVKAERWDGKLPQFTGGAIPLLNLGGTPK